MSELASSYRELGLPEGVPGAPFEEKRAGEWGQKVWILQKVSHICRDNVGCLLGYGATSKGSGVNTVFYI